MTIIMVIMIIATTIIITIMKIQKVVTVIVAIMMIICSFGNDNCDKSYDWSHVLLIQVFLNLSFYNYG